MRDRRAFISSLVFGVVLALLPSESWPKAPRIGWLTITAVPDPPRLEKLRQGLREGGYTDWQSVPIEVRFAPGTSAELDEFAADLVRRKVDVILAVSPAALQAARKATTTIPIVAYDLETDPLAGGIVASLARPGGNVTGLFNDFPELAGKWLQLLKEIVPPLARVAVLWDPETGRAQLTAAEAAARQLGLQLQILEVLRPADFAGALRSAAQTHANAVLVLSSPKVSGNSKHIADIAMRHRLPTITLFPAFAKEGGLLSYGPDNIDLYRHSGVLVGKILNGANPAELPVERPSRFELIINRRTAKALGLTIPQALLLRANQVVE